MHKQSTKGDIMISIEKALATADTPQEHSGHYEDLQNLVRLLCAELSQLRDSQE